MNWKIYWLVLGCFWLIMIIASLFDKDLMTNEALTRCIIWIVVSILGLCVESAKDAIIKEIKKNKDE